MSLEEKIMLKLQEAEFSVGSDTYKSVFGKYYKNDKEITRNDYFNAKATPSAQLKKTPLNYRDDSDEDLLDASRRGDRRAQDILISRYEKLVWHISKPYFLPGAEQQDLVQEGLLGVYDAMDKYDPRKNGSFKDFAMLAAKRNILNAVQAATRKKREIENDYDNLDDVVTSTSRGNPEKAYQDKADYDRLINYVNKNFSPLEKDIFSSYIKGYKYDDMAKRLNKSYKSIEKAMERIRYKLKNYKSSIKDSRVIRLLNDSLLLEVLKQ